MFPPADQLPSDARQNAAGTQSVVGRKDEAVDSQQVEIIGRNLLVSHLLAGGVEVARPERDKGIDLIVYLDRSPSEFVARPLQLKASSRAAFGVDQKYAKTPGLLLAYVWRAAMPTEAVIHALTYAEAVAVAEGLGWTGTLAWANGSYVTTNPSKKVVAALEPYRMEPADWISRIERY